MNKTFNQFSDIEHRPLRIYNRSVMVFNVLEDHGEATAREYLESFSPEERLEIGQMTALVRKRGNKVVKEMVTKGLNFVDEPYREAAV